jgi:hypothetical protein
MLLLLLMTNHQGAAYVRGSVPWVCVQRSALANKDTHIHTPTKWLACCMRRQCVCSIIAYVCARAALAAPSHTHVCCLWPHDDELWAAVERLAKRCSD